MSDTVDEKNLQEIGDLIADYVPPVEGATEEEVKVDGQEGQERSEEAAGGQVEAVAESGKEEKEEVKPPVEGEPGPAPVAAPVVEVKPPEELAPVVEKTEIELMREENAALKAHIEEIVGKLAGPREVKPVTEEERVAQAEAAKKQVLQFIDSNETFDTVMSDVKNFNALLTAVVNTSVERGLRMIPQVVTSIVDQTVTLKTAVADFYRANGDLVPHKKYVGFIANEVTAEHPDWELEKVMEEVENQARGKLRLPKREVIESQQNISSPSGGGESTAKVKNPGFVPGGGGGGRRGSVSSSGNLTKVEKDILDIIQ